MKRVLTVFAAATLAAWAAPAPQQDTGQSQQDTSQSQQSTSQPQQSTSQPSPSQRQATSGSAERMQETTITTDTKTTKTSTHTIYGKVQGYEKNKSIEITVPGKTETSRTIDLTGKDLTARVAPNVKVGDWVKLVQKTDNSGKKAVTVEESSQHAARMMTAEQSGQARQPSGGKGTAHRKR
jgi:hypothetical protein